MTQTVSCHSRTRCYLGQITWDSVIYTPPRTMAPSGSLKRKQPSKSSIPPSSSKRAAKRVKTSSARTILAQASDKALSKNGDLDVSAFVKAREFEIKAMAASMAASKDSLSTRAFQQMPRELRRRTASHNVKKVPKRLRARAAKEVRRAHKQHLQRPRITDLVPQVER